MPIFPSSIYSKWLGDINSGGVMSDTPKQTTKPTERQWVDEPTERQWVDETPTTTTKSSEPQSFWEKANRQIIQGGLDFDRLALQGIGGIAQMFADPATTMHHQSEDLANKAMSLVPYKDNPFVDLSKVGTGGSADISMPISHRIGAMGLDFLGYDTEGTAKDIAEGNYGSAAAKVAAPTALNWALGKALHMPAEKPGIRPGFEPPPPPSAPPPPAAATPKPRISAADYIRMRDARGGIDLGPTPTMADMAPRTSTELPSGHPSGGVPGTVSDIEGVIFQGDHAVLTAATETNMAALRQRGYEKTGKLQNGWPVWHKTPNLGETAFTRAMRASAERGAGITSEPMPEGMQGTPISPTEPIILSERLATADKLLELEESGYVVNRKLPDGSIELIPSHRGGGGVMSDPFGVGTVTRGVGSVIGAIKRMREGRVNPVSDRVPAHEQVNDLATIEDATRNEIGGLINHWQNQVDTLSPNSGRYAHATDMLEEAKTQQRNIFKVTGESIPELPARTPFDEMTPQELEGEHQQMRSAALPELDTMLSDYSNAMVYAPEAHKPAIQALIDEGYRLRTEKGGNPLDVTNNASARTLPVDDVLDREMGWSHFASEPPSNQKPARTTTPGRPPGGQDVFSDPFGIGVIGRALRGMRSVEQPAGGGRGGGGITEHPNRAIDTDRIATVTSPRAIQYLQDTFQNALDNARTRGDTAGVTHYTEMMDLAMRRSDEIYRNQGAQARQNLGGPRLQTAPASGGATIGQRLRAAVSPSNQLDMATERARIMAATTDGERQMLATEYRELGDEARRQGRNDNARIYDDLATEVHDVIQFGQQSQIGVDPDHQFMLDQIRASNDVNHLTDIIDEHTRLAANADSMGDSAMADQFREVIDEATRQRTRLNRFTPQLNRRPQPVMTNDEVIAHNTRIRNITTEAEGQALMDEFRQARQDAIDVGNRPRAQQFAELERTADDRRGDIWYQNYSRRGRYNYNSRPTPLRVIDEPAELSQIRAIDNESGAQNAADQYSGMHETAVATGDTAAQAQMEMLYNESVKRYKELVKERESQGAAVNPDAKTPQQIMDEYMHNPANRKTPKEIARYEAKKKRGMSGVATQLQGLEGFEGAAQTVDSGDFSTSIDHNYARQQLQFVPKGAPGIEFIVEQAPQTLNDTGRYKVIYRNSEGNAIIKTEFSSQYGIGKIASWTYDQYLHRQGGQAGLNGRAMFKVAKAMAPYGVKMPSGSFSRFTANLMSNINRAGSHSNSGFINLGELFGENPDGNATLVDYVKKFFSKKNDKGQTVADIPKLAAKMQEAKQINSGEQPSTTTKGEKKPSVAREAYNFTRGMTTTGDLSAALRQGLPMVFSKKYWSAMKPMFKSLGSEEAFNKTLADLNARPLFQRQWDSSTGKLTKSFAEIADMKLSDLDTHLTSREEAVASNWAETGGFLGSDLPFVNRETGLQRGYQKSIGRYSRATNRAYTAFLNQLRADSFEGLIKDAYRDSQSKGKGARDPYTDLTYAKDIAAAVNTLTGRGPLKFATPGVAGGRFGEGGHIVWKERSAERLAPVLSDIIFSPRLLASRIRMLNPGTYMMASPFVRKQYLKGLLSVVGFNVALGTLAKGAGADVSLDPNSADFGKIKVGNTRLDFGGGFQQYFVAVSRLMSGHTTSSATGKDFELGQGYRPPTRRTIAQNFAVNKLHPVMKFAYDMADASSHQPFQVGDRTMQLFVPLIVGDVLELAKEDPKLLPLIAPIAFGAGSQTYDKGSPTSKYIPKEYEPWTFTGGEVIK